MMSEIIETRTQKMWLGEDGIIYAVVLPNAELSLEDAVENTAAEARLAGGQKRPLLGDIRATKSISREVREHFAGDFVQTFATAVALIVSSPLSKTIANLVILINKPRYPMKMFTTQEEAVEWLKSLDEKT